MKPARVLIVDADGGVLRAIRAQLPTDWIIVTTTSAARGWVFARDGAFDAILCDTDALAKEEELMALLEALGPLGKRRLILITSNPNDVSWVRPTLIKPFTKAELLFTLALIAKNGSVPRGCVPQFNWRVAAGRRR